MNSTSELAAGIIVISVLVLILCVFIMLLMVMFLRRRTQFEKTLLQSQIEIQEATVASLATELHDNIGQQLSTTKLLMGVYQRSTQEQSEVFETAQQTLSDAIVNLRSLSKSLTSEWLSQFDLMQNLHAEVARINVSGQIQIHCSGPQMLPLSSDQQIILFRILQEAIQNALKHARASGVWIEVQEDAGCVRVTVVDNGIGFDPKSQRNGIGLMNMKNRSALLNGTIEWFTEIEKGTRVAITIPSK